MSDGNLPLTDLLISEIKPQNKQLKLFDGGGLFLLINPNGTKWWRFKYHFGRKEKLLSFGTYPDVSLSEARALGDNASQLLSRGLDPSAVRKEEKAREKAKPLGGQSLTLPSVRILMDGVIEIWKGHNVMRLDPDEAKFITGMLGKIVR